MNPNDPAFEPLIWKQRPLTKREYFAALAMQGIAASHGEATIMPNETQNQAIARVAVLYADTLIVELSKEKETFK